MMRAAIQEINGLRFMIDQLDIQSGVGKRLLLNSPFMTRAEDIGNELSKVEFFYHFFKDRSHKSALSDLQIKLMQVRDIRGTVSRLKDRLVLDDIELFELKTFCLLSKEISFILERSEINFIIIPYLDEVFDILDPDKTNIAHFYIYDSYSAELTAIRKQLKTIQRNTAEEEAQAEKLYLQSVELEDEIRKELSEKIHPRAVEIAWALNAIGQLDILIAKALLAIGMNLCKPEVTTGTTEYKAIFNPQIKAALQAAGKDFQAIDLSIEKCATLITGANMTGKSVILKTTALAQTLFQFGLYIPAEKAVIAPVDEVIISVGDEQNELSGLSSFAAEMQKVDKIVQETKAGKNLLVLIDELARTTNPTEGKAIVNAVVDFLTGYNVRALITTHYSGIESSCRKFRVKGFIKDRVQEILTIQNINNYIDYSLVEDASETVPHEAIQIASILGVDAELLEKAKGYLKE